MAIPTRAEARALLADLIPNYYLIENEHRIRWPNSQGGQFNYTRRPKSWGTGPIPIGVLHSYEAPITRSIIAAADYIVTRTNGPGSYHGLAGNDHPRDVLPMAPVTAETWHCRYTNPFTIGWSAVMYAHTWRTISARDRDNMVKSLAYGFYLSSLELIALGKSPIPAKRITRDEALRGVWGFLMHRHTDPWRRSDLANPESDFPWSAFFAEYTRLLGGDTTAPTGDLTVSEAKKILEKLDELTTITLSDSQQKALVSKRERWGLGQLLGVIAHRAGYAFQWSDQSRRRIREVEAKVDALTEAVMAVGEVSGMDRAEVQAVVTDTLAESELRLQLPDEDVTDPEEG